MNVYLLEVAHWEEDCELLGVYSTRRLAESHAGRQCSRRRKAWDWVQEAENTWRLKYSDIYITEVPLDPK